MGLSDREKKIIQEMEAALLAEDPRLVSTIERSGKITNRFGLNILAILAGIALILAGVIAKVVLLGVGGFLIALAGAATMKIHPSLPRKRAPRSRTRMQERWERRNGE